ncbi:MAG TPA: methyltransferase domain-containing protein [Terriglobia bacterium]|nr:methyltransferase domain-containing protein [Terriglobia bacterium]
MDDLSRPEHEFAAAYRELKIINRTLGGVRAIERFLPPAKKGVNLLMLDVAAGACDVSEALLEKLPCRIVTLDLNARGLKLADKSWPVVADALALPFREDTFDVVMASLFFHHLSNDNCVQVLSQMWRIAKQRILINDLHRHAVAYFSIRALTALFSKSRMVRHDGPVSVLRAFRSRELLDIARRAGVPAQVHRSFPYRLVLVADK